MPSPNNATKFPGYIEVTQAQMLSGFAEVEHQDAANTSSIDTQAYADNFDLSGPYNVEFAVKRALDAINPYDAREMIDPTGYFSDIRTHLDEMKDTVDFEVPTQYLDLWDAVKGSLVGFIEMEATPAEFNDFTEALAYLDLIQPQIDAASDAIAEIPVDLESVREFLLAVQVDPIDQDLVLEAIDDSIETLVGYIGEGGIPDSEAFEESRRPDLMRAYNRIMAPIVEGNGVIGTALPNWSAIIEAEHLRNVASYAENRTFELERLRLTAMRDVVQLRLERARAERELYQADLTRTQISVGVAQGLIQTYDVERSALSTVGELRSRIAQTQTALTDLRLRVNEGGRANFLAESNHYQMQLAFLSDGLKVIAQLLMIRLNQATTVYEAEKQYHGGYLESMDGYTKDVIEADAQHLMWDLDVLTKGSSVIGASAGIPSMRQGLSERDRALSMLGTATGLTLTGASAMLPLAIGAVAMFKCDRRLKQNISPIPDMSEFLNLLEVYQFEYLPEARAAFGPLAGEGKQIGFMADEVEKVLPGAVSELAGYKVVLPMPLIATLWLTVKDLARRVEELEAK